MNSLLEELSKERKTIKTDSYDMSIGEIINLYKSGDLKLTPAYQRLYRWDIWHKSNFIESILIGIPIPQIFVAQKSDGKWDIIDGVQRISTLLQLVGILPNYDPLKLEETKYLKGLKNKGWDDLPNEAKRILKRTRIGVNIILTENSIDSQYELFQRLNTGGMRLEGQEIRNCLMIMIDENFYNKINDLKEYNSFLKCIALKNEKIKIEYHMELILRYLIAKNNKVNYDEYSSSDEKISDFLDKETVRLIEDKEFDLEEEMNLFKKVMDKIYLVMGNKIFKKYNIEKDRFEGQFIMSSYEAVLTGVAENFDSIKWDTFEDKVKALYKEKTYNDYTTRGVRVLKRFKGLTQFSKEYFSK